MNLKVNKIKVNKVKIKLRPVESGIKKLKRILKILNDIVLKIKIESEWLRRHIN